MFLAFWKQFFTPVRLYGGGGDSGSGAQSAAEAQMAQISTDQWNYFQNTWLPQATTAAGTSDAQGATNQSTYNNSVIPQTQANQTATENAAAAANASDQGIAASDQSNAAGQVALSGADQSQAATNNAQASTLNGQAAGQFAANNTYGIGDLGGMQDMADYYLSAAGQQQEAGIAAGNVTQQYANANQAAIAAAEQRGINAGSGEMMNTINQNNIGEAAASAAAQTQARQAALSLGWNYLTATQQAGAAQGQQATANSTAANAALSNANNSLSNANTALTAASTSNTDASNALSNGVSGLSTGAAGISNVEGAMSGAQQAAGIPLGNLSTIGAGMNGGASSATAAANGSGNIASQQASTQAQENQSNSAGIGSAIGGAAALGAIALMA